LKADAAFIKEFIKLDTVDSTNSYALSLARPFAAVSAEYQTAGRGRRSHSWHSEKGNLYLSITLPGADTRYPILAGVAVRDAISSIINTHDVFIKWPNDILVNGKKVSGILCESRSHITAIGIGINVNQTVWPEDIIKKATSLKQLTGNDYALRNILLMVVDNLGFWYRTFLEKGFIPVKESFLRHHITSDYKPALSDGASITITDINMDGSLVVETPTEKRTLIDEEIFFQGYSDL
jgi:BirA family biotin operon repressor/biotin-[acetyl-CoA-carboxylase] ligase